MDREQVLKNKLQQVESQLESLSNDNDAEIDQYPHITAFFKDTEDLNTLPWKFEKMTSDEKNVLFKRYIDHVTYLKHPLTLDIKWTPEVEQAIKEHQNWKQEVRQKRKTS